MIDEKCCRYCMEYVNGVCLNYEVNKMVETDYFELFRLVEDGKIRDMIDDDDELNGYSNETKEIITDFIYNIPIKFESWFEPNQDFYCKHWR